MADFITIDGLTYNVPVTALRRRAEFLDKYAERTEDGVLHRELIGVYYNYEVEFGTDAALADYNALFDKLSEAVEFHTVTVLGTTFTAYFSSISDEVRKVQGADAYWKGLTAHFIAKMPARVP